MAKIYYDLIKSGHRTLEQVPINWREQVRIMLEKDK